MPVKSSAKILGAFHICPADSCRSGALWRHPSLSDTRAGKMEHFLWWPPASPSGIRLKLIRRRKVWPWIVSLSPNFSMWARKGINSAQVVQEQIPWIQTQLALSTTWYSYRQSNIFISNRAKWQGTMGNMHPSSFFYQCAFVSLNNSSLPSDKWKIDEKLITAIQGFPATGVNIWETMLE